MIVKQLVRIAQSEFEPESVTSGFVMKLQIQVEKIAKDWRSLAVKPCERVNWNNN